MRNGRREALDALIASVYSELRAIAHRHLSHDRDAATLATTALVHETYLKLVDQSRTTWHDRAHFLALAAVAMRHILTDHARARVALKRGGDARPITLDEASIALAEPPAALLMLDDALDELAIVDARMARVVECRFFAGLTHDEIAAALGVTVRTVDRDWIKARTWLRELLSKRTGRGGEDDDAGGTIALRAELERALGGAYRLGAELAAGGMSRVFLAEERGGARAVVVKVLAPELAVGINAERFEREIRILASMRHRNIVPLLAAGRTRHVPYYMMPMVGRHTLRDRITRKGALAIGRAIAVLRDIARALAYAHERHVVHRDVKPGNVLLGDDRAFVSDFGIAKALIAAGTARQSATVTQRGVGIGTPAYMSPEQAAGDPATDHRTDVYAFGCLAYEVFAGRSPFHGRSVHETIAAHFNEKPRRLTYYRPDAPPHIARLVARCLEKNPDRRPQSAAELLHVLERSIAMPTSVDESTSMDRRSFRP